MIYNLDKSQYTINGENGLPESYPVPEMTQDHLFYIQRNLNKNTIIYSANITHRGLIDESQPIKLHWIKYTDNGKIAKLNLIQEKAFGYHSSKINDYTYEIKMLSYDKLSLFLHMDEEGKCSVITKISDNNAYLSNIYVYADEFGIFPQIKIIELYGSDIKSKLPSYQRITI